MMSIPILWRYLLIHYFRMLCLCTCAFIAVLLVMRLDDIAHFATLGASGYYLFLFVVHQIPYILPIAIPLSSLISITLFLQRLSQTHELTALRASGFGLKAILTPVLIASAYLSLFNFYIVSEMATDSHLSSGLLRREILTVNPLLLLNNKHLMRVKGYYYNILGPSKLGEVASDVVLAIPNRQSNGINLLLAKNLRTSAHSFTGAGMTVISTVNANNDQYYDHLMTETIDHASTSLQDFAQAIQKKVWTLSNDHLRMPLLRVRIDEARNAIVAAEISQRPVNEVKTLRRDIYRGYSEILRRVSLSLAVFTFTLMGAAFGMNISRYRSHRGIIFVVVLTALYIIAFFAAKGIENHLEAAALLYLMPHVIIVALSIWSLRRVARGIE